MVKLKDAIAGMSTKEKVDYIWEYYKLHIIGVLFLIIFAVLMVDGLLNKGEDPLGITVVSEANLEQINTVETELNALDFETFNLFFEHIQHQGGLIEDNAIELMERLAMTIGVGQVDILVTNAPFAEQLISEDILAPLDEIVDVNRLVEQGHQMLEVNGDIYGVSTAHFAIFDQHDVYHETYLFVPGSGRNKDEAELFIQYLSR